MLRNNFNKMSKAIIIIDYNNVFTCDSCTPEEIEITLNDVINRALNNSSQIDEFYIRIYGGWYQNEMLTDRGSDVMLKFSQINPIPNLYENRRIKGNIEFVEQIYGVDFSWKNTYREKAGPRLIIRKDKHNSHCTNNKEKCPVEILAKFTKHNARICNVEGCQTKNMDVFSQIGQKMVDTMMVCDILTYGEEEDTEFIYVLTDDVDLYPSLVLCCCKNPHVNLFVGTRNNKYQKEQNIISNNFNIQYFSLL